MLHALGYVVPISPSRNLCEIFGFLYKKNQIQGINEHSCHIFWHMSGMGSYASTVRIYCVNISF